MTVSAIVGFLKSVSKDMTWEEVKTDFKKPGFLASVLDFSADKLKQKTVDFIKTKFLNTPEWDI